MMSSNRIFDMIQEIAATSSKNDKEALVKFGALDNDFCRVLEYSYNPFKTYGISKRPETIGEHVGSEFDTGTWELLDALIARKLTGTAAIEAVRGEMTALSKESAELFWRIVKKDLRAGFGESTINKAKKGLIPEFPYMRCSLPKDAKMAGWAWSEGMISQEKADGMFANVDHEANGMVSIRSRQGTEFPVEKFEDFVAEVRASLLPGHQQHGEFVVYRDGVLLNREIGNGVMNHVISGGDFAPNEKPVYMIWDQIPLASVVPKGKFDKPYCKRLGSIILQLKDSKSGSLRLIDTRIVFDIAEAYRHAAELMRKGKEGSVIKNRHGTWKDGTSVDQVKLKLEFVVDLEIEAVLPGAPGTKVEGRAGAFSCVSYDGKLRVNVAVKNEKMRDAVDADNGDWVGRIIAVKANDIMPPSESNEYHSLFLPRMAEVGYRTDKNRADTLERIQAQKQAAIFGESLLKAA